MMAFGWWCYEFALFVAEITFLNLMLANMEFRKGQVKRYKRADDTETRKDIGDKIDISNMNITKLMGLAAIGMYAIIENLVDHIL